MCRSPHLSSKQSNASIVWSSLTEHLLKTAAYTAFVLHAVISVQRSTTTFSYTINTLIGLTALYMIKNELTYAIKRIQRKLPPGYIGVPVSSACWFFLFAFENADHYSHIHHTSFLNSLPFVVYYSRTDISWNQVLRARCQRWDPTSTWNCAHQIWFVLHTEFPRFNKYCHGRAGWFIMAIQQRSQGINWNCMAAKYCHATRSRR